MLSKWAMMVVMGLGFTMVFSSNASASASEWFELHGPEKPPPDDGYEFKGASGGNGLGKLGLLSMGVGLVTSVLYLTAEPGSEKKDNMGRNSAILLGGGLGLLVIERAR